MQFTRDLAVAFGDWLEREQIRRALLAERPELEGELLLDPVLGSLGLGGRIVLLVAGCLILAFGMTVVISSDLGAGPNDLVAVSISEIFKKPFGAVRVCVDVAFALAGWLLGGVLGAGTVVCAFLVGPAAQLLFPLSRRLCALGLKGAGGELENKR